MNKRLVIIIAILAIIGIAYFVSRDSTSHSKPVAPKETVPTQKQAALSKSAALEKIAAIKTAHQQGQKVDNETLLALYVDYPAIFFDDEEAALLLASALINNHQNREYLELYKHWKSQAKQQDQWLIIDAKALIQEGKIKDATTLLNSTSFEGTQDIPRLLLLAQLSENQSPKRAIKYLKEAHEKDSKNPEIHLVRARIAEKANQLTRARNEYAKALHLGANQVAIIEQTGDFYSRQGEYSKALRVWEKGLNHPHSDELWVKVLFWSHVTGNKIRENHKEQLPSGSLRPYIEYLAALPTGQFWDQQAFEAISNHEEILKSQQEAFWLVLLDTLSKGNEADAFELIQQSPFQKDAWTPDLQVALYSLLNYRLHNSFEVTPELISRTASIESENPFISELVDVVHGSEPSDQLIEVAKSDDAFAAALLGVRWLEAGLALNRLEVLPESFPEWVAVDLTEAIKKTRGTKEALEFALKQPSTPHLHLLIDELYISNGNRGGGLDHLTKYIHEDTSIGSRAAFVVARLQIEKGDYEAARKTIDSNRLLASDVSGKELLAKIALKEGNEADALQIYLAIAEESQEAKIFLAEKSIQDQEWENARKLTVELLNSNPEDKRLRANLRKINKALKSETVKE